MVLHPPTIVILSITVDLLLVLILLHAWRTRTTYPGFLYWVAGTACWTVGSFFNMVLADLQPVFIPRIIGMGLILLHPILLYEGLVRFYGLKRRWFRTPLNLALGGLQLLISLYYIYVVEDYALRSATFALVFSFLFVRIALEPLLHRDIRCHSMQWLMSVSILPLITLMLLRAAYFFGNADAISHITTELSSDLLLRWILIYGFVVELVIAYSYLSLTSDRVERELHEARQTAEAASRVKDSFLQMVSHELRTPLATITGIADLLNRRASADDELPRMLQRATLQQQRLINDLLDSAAIETGTITITPHPFSLRQLLDEFRETYLPRTRAKGITYQGIRSDDLPDMIMGDRQRIFQVCANLFENALKYTPPGGSIIARAELVKDQTPPLLCFSATDTGCGIPADQQEAIFNPFVSLEPGNAGLGLGLGLAICRQLAAAMGGHLTCESTPGAGSTFRFTIPCELPPPDWREPDVPNVSNICLQQPLQILAVDDTPENLQLLELLLQGTPVSLTRASSAQQALELLDQHRFDLLLTDIRMPGMTGLQLVQAIRNSEQQQGRHPLRMVAISANTSPGEIQAALDAGCAGYLPRPFTLQALLQELALAKPSAETVPPVMTEDQTEQFSRLQEQARQRISSAGLLIEEALKNGDDAVIREEGHRIKGLGMTFGLADAERIGGLLEQAERAETAKLLEELQRYLFLLKTQPD